VVLIPIDISEDSGLTWEKMPQWVEYFIELGIMWPRKVSGPRRKIRIISMPVKSPAAGLVALGAFVADLSDSAANDKSRHYDVLLGYAQQYLSRCKNCKLRCRPDLTNCGYTSESTGVLRNVNKLREKYYVQKETNLLTKDLRLATRQDGTGVKIGFYSPEGSHNYYIDGGAPLSLGGSTNWYDSDPIKEIFHQNFFNDNFKTSYSALCYAGVASGEAATQSDLAKFIFKTSKNKSLAELLPIYGWDNGNTELSRVIYYNSRGKGTFSQPVNSPNLIIADGTDALNSVLSQHKKLGEADIIAIVNRIIERDKMEEFSDRLDSLTQWYEKIVMSDQCPPGCYQVEYRKRFES
jgi:hypothetical protein